MLSFLLALCMFFAPAPAPQDPDPLLVWMDGTVVMALHQDTNITASVLAEDGVIVTSTTAPQSPGGGTAPTLTTSYLDKNGATHTITTPVVSTTPAGLESAKTTHRALVQLMQGMYPPKTT
jgi:hypothetical protein